MQDNPDRIDELTKEQDEDGLTEEQANRLDDAWTSQLSHRNGRVMVRDLLQLTHFGRSAYAGQNNLTNFNAGKQAIGEYLMEKIGTCYPEAYALMLKEAKEDEENDRRSTRDTRNSEPGAITYTTT